MWVIGQCRAEVQTRCMQSRGACRAGEMCYVLRQRCRGAE